MKIFFLTNSLRSTSGYETHEPITENILHVIPSPDLSMESFSNKLEITTPQTYFPISSGSPEKLSLSPNKYLTSASMYQLINLEVPLPTPDSLLIIQHLPQQHLFQDNFSSFETNDIETENISFDSTTSGTRDNYIMISTDLLNL